MKLGLKYILFLGFALTACGSDDEGGGGPTNPPVEGSCDLSIPIYDDLVGNELFQKVKTCFTPTTTFSYADARDILYTDVDVVDGKIQTIYTGYSTTLDYDSFSSPRAAAFDKGINAEHVFPQSMGAGEVPARSDMFHLFPCREEVNSARSNYRFDEIDDAMTDRWFYLSNQSSTIPSSNIDIWTEGVGLGSANGRWEPREDEKGDIARAVFYFVTIHNNVASSSYFTTMKDQLLLWHIQDPVDQEEQTRNDKIKTHQGNDNPYILDATLVDRVFGS